MAHAPIRIAPVGWDQLNIKVRLGSLLFDILLDGNIYPMEIVRTMKHNHAAFELQFIDSGSGTLVLEDREQALEAGTIHIIGQHIFHSFLPDPAVPGARSTFRFTFQEASTLDPNFPQEEADRIQASLSRLTYCGLTDPARNRTIFRLLAEVRAEVETPSLGSYSKVLSLFAQLIVELVRGIQLEQQADRQYPLPQKNKYDQWSYLIDHFFHHFQQDLTLEQLAASLNLSTKQTQRVLKKHFHTTFKQKLMDTRVEVAKDWLRTSRLSVERIAADVGYSSTQYFCQLFQHKTGLTPSEYRLAEQAGIPGLAKTDPASIRPVTAAPSPP